MVDNDFSAPIRLFFSYSHKDEHCRDNVEKALHQLKREKLLNTWYDQKILPGQSIEARIRKRMNESEIFVFLFSQSFIASDACEKEWKYAKKIASNRQGIYRIPIILENCSWQDFLGDDDVKALPKDGKPVNEFSDPSVPFHNIYDGIRKVVNELRNNFLPKQKFLEDIQKTDFLSEKHIDLEQVFVFPTLSCYSTKPKEASVIEEEITNEKQILEKRYVLIHGDDMSGKTALGRYIILYLISINQPVLCLDLKSISGRPREDVLVDAYYSQFHGDYLIWKNERDKTLVLDNLSHDSDLIDFVAFFQNHFDNIIVTLSSDIFISFFRDEKRLASFCEMKIEPLTHSKQEALIRKRLELSNSEETIADGKVDQVERQVNDIINVARIVPRYPFYVLSILQTYEGYMPNDLSITSQGHCYYVLIVASLIKSGISRKDEDINACFNFAEHWAFFQFTHKNDICDFDQFLIDYRKDYILGNSVLNRMKGNNYGIFFDDGQFKAPYMYYFFLGRFLSRNKEACKSHIERICAENYLKENYLTLLFIIYHTSDDEVIDDILLRTMCTLDIAKPATLDSSETKKFSSLVEKLKNNILSEEGVDEQRRSERDSRDLNEQNKKADTQSEDDTINDIYRLLKNNEILGQVLRNKYGSIKITKLKEIVETITDGGLRLVNALLRNEEEITELALYLHKKYPDHDIYEIKNRLQAFSFIWTMLNVERVVAAVNHSEIIGIVTDVVEEKSTAAYDLIGYFARLDSSEELNDEIRNELKRLLKKHQHLFFRSVLSIRTQHYMNTHRSKTQIEQSICSALKIKYIQRHKQI